jgi:endonuclease/exonuclease/phosphatase (EEP) superfamily protein YafD
MLLQPSRDKKHHARTGEFMFFFDGMAILVIVLTFLSLVPSDRWWIRAADFPRLQLLCLGVVSLLGILIADGQLRSWTQLLLLAVLGLALGYQLKMLLPYTWLWKKQVLSLEPKQQDRQNTLSVLVANVLTPNQHYARLIAHVQRLQPDLLLTLESDSRWQQALEVIEQDYPYSVKVPLDNLYGMHLYSRLPLQHSRVDFILTPEIPSIFTQMMLPSGQPVDVYCLHPKPPSPTEAKESTLRDAELLIVAEQIRARPQTCIVMGDLNDVAWSRTTRLFQRISGLLDPRVGRYFINTFHAQYPFLRWSLDHVFHSRDWVLVEMQRLSDIGSDHFPVYTVLQLAQHKRAQQPAVAETQSDQQLAADKIQNGIDKAEQES